MGIENSTETALFLKPKKWVINTLFILLLLLGFAVRLIDFTDLPLDFANTRQLHSLIMARGYYYRMDNADTASMDQSIRQYGISTGNDEPKIEPPVMEYLAAITYWVMGGENIFVGRFYSILFWVLGGIPLFLLARKMMSINGAFSALAFYLFLPFSVYASRSFQPDPLMVFCIIWAWYFQITWERQQTTKNAVLAGLSTGLAIFIKAPAAFFVGFSFAGLVLSTGFKNWIKNKQVYYMILLSLLPAVVFNILSATVGGNAGSIFGARFFPELFIDPKWYLKWLVMIKSVIGYYPLFIGLLAFFLIRKKQERAFYFSIWFGYLLYGFVFAYHIYTHNYYQLPLLPLVALGFGYALSLAFEKLELINKDWLSRVLIILVFVFSIGYTVVRFRGELISASYRHEAKYWTELGEKIGRDSDVIALTHDYGYRISYWGYINPKLWPTAADQTVKDLSGSSDPAFIQMFKEYTVGRDYFLVTLIGEMESQPELKEYLFDNYPYEQGDGYYLFDLNQPLSQPN